MLNLSDQNCCVFPFWSHVFMFYLMCCARLYWDCSSSPAELLEGLHEQSQQVWLGLCNQSHRAVYHRLVGLSHGEKKSHCSLELCVGRLPPWREYVWQTPTWWDCFRQTPTRWYMSDIWQTPIWWRVSDKLSLGGIMSYRLPLCGTVSSSFLHWWELVRQTLTCWD